MNGRKIGSAVAGVLSFVYLAGSLWLLLAVCGHCCPRLENRVRSVIGGLEDSPVREAFVTFSDGLEAGLPIRDTVEASVEILFGTQT